MVSTGCLADFFTSAPELGFFGLIFSFVEFIPKDYVGFSWEGVEKELQL